MPGHDGDRVVFGNIHESVFEGEQLRSVPGLNKGVDVHGDGLRRKELNDLAFFGLAHFQKLTPSAKVLAAIGVASGNALDELLTSRILTELETLDGLAFPRTPKANGIFWDFSATVVYNETTPRCGFVDQVTTDGPVFRISRRWNDRGGSCGKRRFGPHDR